MLGFLIPVSSMNSSQGRPFTLLLDIELVASVLFSIFLVITLIS